MTLTCILIQIAPPDLNLPLYSTFVTLVVLEYHQIFLIYTAQSKKTPLILFDNAKKPEVLPPQQKNTLSLKINKCPFIYFK